MMVRTLSLMILGPFILYFAFNHGREAVDAYRSLTWEPVPCTLLGCAIGHEVWHDSYHSNPTTQRDVTLYDLSIAYRYRFGGKEYQGIQQPLHPSNSIVILPFEW